MFALFAGLFAGALHVVSGPDHLAAIAPFSATGKKRAARIGLRWGIGHSGGVILVGLVALLFRDTFNVIAFSSAAEWLVGVTLIAIGLWGLRQAYADRIHDGNHEHGPVQHAHIHLANRHSHAAWAIGTLHGLAGSSHFFGIIPALAFPTIGEAVAFLTAYGAGTMAAMTLFAAGLGGIASRFEHLTKPLFATCSATALVIGCAWLFL